MKIDKPIDPSTLNDYDWKIISEENVTDHFAMAMYATTETMEKPREAWVYGYTQIDADGEETGKNIMLYAQITKQDDGYHIYRDNVVYGRPEDAEGPYSDSAIHRPIGFGPYETYEEARQVVEDIMIKYEDGSIMGYVLNGMVQAFELNGE